LVIEGRKTTASSNLLLDDITLSKESCDRIPRTGNPSSLLLFRTKFHVQPIFYYQSLKSFSIPFPAEPYNRYSSYGAIRYWKLDGTDRNIRYVLYVLYTRHLEKGVHTHIALSIGRFKSLVKYQLMWIFYHNRSFGSIIHKEDNGRMVTCFDGKTTHLETPAVDFHTRSFTITCWVKVKDPGLMGHIYSDWSHPFQFRLYAYHESLIAVLRGSGGVHNLVFLSTWVQQSLHVYLAIISYSLKCKRFFSLDFWLADGRPTNNCNLPSSACFYQIKPCILIDRLTYIF
jgi:hypothetical protein